MTILLKYYYLLLIILGFSVTQAQTFNERILFVEDSILAMDFSNVIIKEDTIITIGRGAIWLLPNVPGKIMISKFDFEGNLLNWFNEYGPDTLSEFIPYAGRSIHQKGDKMLIVGGAGGYFANSSGFAAMIDKHSTVDWIKIYPPTEESYAYRFISGLILANDNLLFLVRRQATGWPEDYPLSTILIRADHLGNILWEREYKIPFMNVSTSCFMADTDTTFLIGSTIGDNIHAYSRIIRVNQTGDVLSEWINETERTDEPNKILQTPDGGFVFVGRYLKEITDEWDRLYQGYICKLDSELNKEWDIEIGYPSIHTRFNSLIKTHDNNFLAVGAVLDTFLSPDTKRQKGYFVKFDENGNIDWEQKIISASNRFSEISDVVETADHGLVACGLSQSSSGDYPQQGWLLKLDEYGCLDANWCDTTYVATRPPPPELNELLQISPNPAQTTIRISFDHSQNSLSKATNITHIQIFNLMGQKFVDKTYGRQSWVEVDVMDLPSGLYIVVVNGQWVRKVVVE